MSQRWQGMDEAGIIGLTSNIDLDAEFHRASGR